MGQMIGRFEVLRALGKGAHGAVFLARDPQVERVVAIKVLRNADPDGGGAGRLLHEARSAGRLRHPGIVQIYDVGPLGHGAYLVYEYVEGRTLGQLLAEGGALPPERAVPLMIEITDALEHAHRSGITHRDLKPANIIVSADGKPRILDFGIAAPIGAGADAAATSGAGLVGTPMYMAPEYIAHGRITPQNDVFAAGLILYEMLFGHPAVRGESVFQVLHQIANQPIALPADAVGRIDEELLDVIAKATAKDPELRYASAAQMRDALEAYSQGGIDAGNSGGKHQSTLDFLLRRMSHKSDFPAMSSSIRSINRLAAADSSNAAALANEILKDFALTNKILRLANSAYYRHHEAGRVRTVSRAIVILGMDAIRNLAISLVLFEHIRDQQHATALKDEFLRATLSGLLARELSFRTGDRQDEEVFVCALFRNLGRLLTRYYFREEADLIARIVAMEHCPEDTAALRVLGLSYRDLGIGIARNWGFPAGILASMDAVPDGRLKAPESRDDQLRLFSAASEKLSGVMEHTPPPQRASAIRGVFQPFGSALGLDLKDAETAMAAALDGLRELTRALGIEWTASPLLQALTPSAKAEPPPGNDAARDLPSLPPDASTDAGNGLAHDSSAILQGGIQDISHALVDDVPADDVLRIIAEIIYRALGALRVVICLRDPKSARLCARYAFGRDPQLALDHFHLPLGENDIFNRVIARDVDVLISDASAEKIRAHLPQWHRDHLRSQSFLILPLRLSERPVGLIYADAEVADGLKITAEDLALLRTLRNQARLALKHDSAAL